MGLRSKRGSTTFFPLVFLVISLATITLILKFLPQIQVLLKRAEGIPPVVELDFDVTSQKPLKRIWPNFAQGGEEKGLMLKPARTEIKKLQPEFIRIDHLFDFGNMVKRGPSGELSFDFTLLDQRIEEITSLGAIPFLSLSYFPQAISANPTETPSSLNDWQLLVEETIKRYSGKHNKNLSGIYYEVWNEPDLFGKMNPEDYFFLYRSTVKASEKCQDCQPFKIGGPAITTVKKNWLNGFLKLVSQNQSRIDFISWHSYQLDPSKTAKEIKMVKSLINPFPLPSSVELIISEWGSLPENSPLHDSLFDASHAVATISLVKDSVNKIFAFELKDGPDPEGKKYWGRWGLLTHESAGLTAKPRFYSFLYLNKLLDQEIKLINASPEVAAIGSTNGKDSYTIIISYLTQTSTPANLNLKLANLPLGTYSVNTYSLNAKQDPLAPQTRQISFIENDPTLNALIYPNSVSLIELYRLSPLIVKVSGKTGQPTDFAGKISSSSPLVFPNPQTSPVSGKISFWFKPGWNKDDLLPHFLFGTKDSSGNGLEAWLENRGSEQVLYFDLLINNQTKEEIFIADVIENSNNWHYFSFSFNNKTSTLSLKTDRSSIISKTLSPDTLIRLGSSLYFGSDPNKLPRSELTPAEPDSASRNNEKGAEGSIDDLKVSFDGQIIYDQDFN